MFEGSDPFSTNSLANNDIRGYELGAVFVFSVLALVVAAVLIDFGSLTSDDMESLSLFSFLFILSLMVVYIGFVKYRELSFISGTPTSKIRSMPMGMVEIKGKALELGDQGTLRAPFSGKECLAYRYEVKEYRRSGDDSRWETINMGTESSQIVIDDGTGQLVVNPKGADLELGELNSYRINSTDEANQHIQSFVQENSGPGGLVFENDRKYKEWILKPGEKTYVLGYASTEKGRNGEYPIIKEDDRQRTFMISDKSEKKLVNSKKWKARIYSVGGVLASIMFYALVISYAGIF